MAARCAKKRVDVIVSVGRSKYRTPAKPIAAMLAKILKPAVRKRGLAGADLVMAWRDIAGPQFADCTLPDRIVWPRSPAGDEIGGAPQPGMLVVRCAGPAAILLQHDTGLIAERVNSFLGWYAVDRIKIIQGPVHAAGDPAPAAAPEIPAAKRTEITHQVAGVKDDRLRAALAELGGHVAADALARRRAG